jgi:hypothetical protein
MTVSFARLQEYLDLIVSAAGENIANSPHKRFWSNWQVLTQQALRSPKCNGQDIYPVKFLDVQHKTVDADNSPLYVVLTNAAGFCGKPQMPAGGPYITDAGYTLMLSDNSIVTGAQVAQDIHDWLTAGAPNN